MAREGYWLNVKTGKAVEITEHCRWIQVEKNARKLRLPKSVYNEIASMDCRRDRVKILMAVMRAGFVRVRGHGNSITFEFTERSERALWAIYMFLEDEGVAGPFANIYIANVRTKENMNIQYGRFKDWMNEDPEKVLRVDHEQDEETLEHIIASLVRQVKRKSS